MIGEVELGGTAAGEDSRLPVREASLWIAPSIPLQFQFAGSRPPTINKAWVLAMLETSHSDRGLVILSEAELDRTPPV
ncbi:hypothetical protein EDF43_1116 [Rathayibacter sp. PhB179]|nr:hypothetical protein EDF49_111189 [Rathayibacter sp. PhB192]TCM25178.1 hypothetical protein EDF43_1116 [Rathayibacter sp. PhB179]